MRQKMRHALKCVKKAAKMFKRLYSLYFFHTFIYIERLYIFFASEAQRLFLRRIKKKPYSKISEPFFVDGSSRLRKIFEFVHSFPRNFSLFYNLCQKLLGMGGRIAPFPL
jgi:hypothetical protein